MTTTKEFENELKKRASHEKDYSTELLTKRSKKRPKLENLHSPRGKNL